MFELHLIRLLSLPNKDNAHGQRSFSTFQIDSIPPSFIIWMLFFHGNGKEKFGIWTFLSLEKGFMVGILF